MKIKLTKNIFPLPISSIKFKKLIKEFLVKQVLKEAPQQPLALKQQVPNTGAVQNKLSNQQTANQKKKDPHNNPKRNGINQPIFPMDFILYKFPNIKKTLTELLTNSFRSYIGNIYVMAPKPTTFKVLLKNKQYFLITYDERSYKVKVSGKYFDLINLSEKERAIEKIADLLNTKQFITTKSEADNEKHSGPGSEKSSKGGGGSHPGRPPENKGGESKEDLSDLDKLLGNEEGGEKGTEGEEKGGEGKEDKGGNVDLKESKIRIKLSLDDITKSMILLEGKMNVLRENQDIHKKMKLYTEGARNLNLQLKQMMKEDGYEV